MSERRKPTLIPLPGKPEHHTNGTSKAARPLRSERRKPPIEPLEGEIFETWIEPSPVSAPHARRRTLAERARTLGGQGIRLHTGVTTLDLACRGGLPMKRLVVVGGAPGAGKTSWLTNLAYRWAREGVYVTILAADEDADALLIRLGQMLGFHRDDLENGHPETRERLAERVEAELQTLELIDVDEDNARLEDVAADLAVRAQGAPSVLVVDSVQTVRALGTESAESKKMRADAVMAALKKVTKKHGHLTLVTSELARGAYRSRNVVEQIDDLAAFKESGDIEYGVGLALVMRSVPDDDGLIDVTVPKNRIGKKTPFRLRMDYARATFSEIDAPTPPEKLTKAQKADALRAAILNAVQENRGLKSARAIDKHVDGFRDRLVFAEVKDMIEEGLIGLVAGEFRVLKASTT